MHHAIVQHSCKAGWCRILGGDTFARGRVSSRRFVPTDRTRTCPCPSCRRSQGVGVAGDRAKIGALEGVIARTLWCTNVQSVMNGHDGSPWTSSRRRLHRGLASTAGVPRQSCGTATRTIFKARSWPLKSNNSIQWTKTEWGCDYQKREAAKPNVRGGNGGGAHPPQACQLEGPQLGGELRLQKKRSSAAAEPQQRWPVRAPR